MYLSQTKQSFTIKYHTYHIRLKVVLFIKESCHAMNIGIIGLGRMGESIAYRLRSKGIPISGFDLSAENCQRASNNGVLIEPSLKDLIEKNQIIWLMVPVDAVDIIIEKISRHAKPKTIVIDGGNSKFSDSQKRHRLLKNRSVHFLDCGTSGGILGKEKGFCLMIGGDEEDIKKVRPYLDVIAAPNAVLHTGPIGSGHYVKMVHNGIEYGIMQAYAEGFHLLHAGAFQDNLDLEKIAAVWNNGSVIRSWLLELTQDIFKEQKNVENISGFAAESGMGRWTVEEGKKQKIPTPVIETAYNVRLESQKTGGNFATKIIALLRNKFGGHTFKKQ